MPASSSMTMNFTFGGKTQRITTQTKPNMADTQDKERAYNHELITRDYDMAIKVNPEFVYAYFNKKSQSFHDKIAKTIVIKN